MWFIFFVHHSATIATTNKKKSRRSRSAASGTMLSSFLRGRKDKDKKDKKKKRKRKETAKLRDSVNPSPGGWMIRRTKSLRKISPSLIERRSHIGHEEPQSTGQADRKDKRGKKKRPRWHCSHCNRFNSSSKSNCSKCLLPRRPKSIAFISSSGSSIIEEPLGPATPTTTSIETPRSLARSASRSMVTLPADFPDTAKLIPTKSVSLNFLPDLERSDAIVRTTPVRQLLEERKAKLEKRNSRLALRLQQKDKASTGEFPSLVVGNKKKKSKSSISKGKKGKKSSLKKKRKKNGIIQKDMKEALQLILTGSSVYARNAKESCHFTR